MAFSTILFTFSALLVLTHGQNPTYWNSMALDSLEEALRLQTLNKNVAKNVIVFIGDGMSLSTTTAARILKGQLAGNPGEETVLNWEAFEHSALAKTYTTNVQVPDSAGTATAIFCGVKTYTGGVGVDGTGTRTNCESSIGTHVPSVLEQAIDAGKSTGVVTTARLTHATPASTYAHSPERVWENDSDLTNAAVDAGCTDIASQFIDAPQINVALGGGRREFLPITETDPEYPGSRGQRRDGRNLVEEWKAEHPANSEFVWNKEQFDDVDPDTIRYLFGLFETGHMQFESERPDDGAGEPSIAEMTDKAIRILSKNSNGFFLAVEGARVDHGHHDNIPYNALHDTLAMEAAVQVAVDLTNQEDTLIIVTADHGHVMAIAGYPDRGDDILGKPSIGGDALPYTTLGYLNGPGGFQTAISFRNNGTRPNLRDVETNSKDHVVETLVPLPSESHSGEDVVIYASGPFAHLFHGVHEQNYIAHVIRYAACLGDGKQVCTDAVEDPCGGTLINSYNTLVLLLLVLTKFLF